MLSLFEYLKYQIKSMEYPDIDAVSRLIDMSLDAGVLAKHQHGYLQMIFEERIVKVCSVGSFKAVQHYLTSQKQKE